MDKIKKQRINWDNILKCIKIPVNPYCLSLITGSSVKNIQSTLKRRGIEYIKKPPLKTHTWNNSKNRSKNIDWNNVNLGMVSDVDISRKLGELPTTVAYQRKLRKIPAFAPEFFYIKCVACGTVKKTRNPRAVYCSKKCVSFCHRHGVSHIDPGIAKVELALRNLEDDIIEKCKPIIEIMCRSHTEVHISKVTGLTIALIKKIKRLLKIETPKNCTIKICLYCEDSFISISSAQKYCCTKHRRLHAANIIKSKIESQKCKMCNKLFLPKRTDNVYCSKKCKRMYHRAANSSNKKRKNERKKYESVRN